MSVPPPRRSTQDALAISSAPQQSRPADSRQSRASPSGRRVSERPAAAAPVADLISDLAGPPTQVAPRSSSQLEPSQSRTLTPRQTATPTDAVDPNDLSGEFGGTLEARAPTRPELSSEFLTPARGHTPTEAADVMDTIPGVKVVAGAPVSKAASEVREAPPPLDPMYLIEQTEVPMVDGFESTALASSPPPRIAAACPGCKATVSNDAKFCSECGFGLRSAARDRESSATTLRCGQCGFAKNQPGTIFCGNCGLKLR